jgi:hypothetical protein
MPATDLAAFVATALKSAHELAMDLRKRETEAEIREGIDEIAARLLDARSHAVGFQELVVSLRRRAKSADIKLINAIAFDGAIDNYVRRETSSGGFVFVERENLEHSPQFCANCFGKRTLSILQPTVLDKVLRCPSCGTVTKD